MLYPVLHRLEKEELIESFWKISENGRKRKYYKIKGQGKIILENEKEQWNLVNSMLNKIW